MRRSRELPRSREASSQSAAPFAPARHTIAGPRRASTNAREAEADRIAARIEPLLGALPSRADQAPIATAAKRELERATQTRLDDVRLDDGAAAAHEATSMHARAFARGSDIAFARGEYQPDTHRGRALVAHELGHVVQQKREHRPRVDRQPVDAEPMAHETILELLGKGVRDAVTSDVAFWELVADEKWFDAEVLEKLAGVSADEQDIVLGAFDGALFRLADITATIELAGQDEPVTVNFDTASKLLSKQLGSADLGSFGLPTSFGTDMFLDYVRDVVSIWVLSASERLAEAYKAFDRTSPTTTLGDALEEAITDEFSLNRDYLQSSLEYGIEKWGDPFGLLELEIEAALAKLNALRSEFMAADTREKRAEIGRKIGYVARLVLVIDHNLAPKAQRIEYRENEERVSSIGETLDGGSVTAVVEEARLAAPTEEDTLLARGNRRSELREKTVEVDSPMYSLAMGDHDVISQEEAYPKYTDETTMTGLRALATNARNQADEVKRLREGVLPERITDLDGFMTIYDRWFGFWSKASRDYDPAFQLVTSIYRLVMPLASGGGPSGWLGGMMFTQTLGDTLATGGADPSSFSGELGRIDFERRGGTSGGVVNATGTGSGVRYNTVEVPTTAGVTTDVAGEAAARDQALSDEASESRSAFRSIYGQRSYTDRVQEARDQDRLPDDPMIPRFWSNDDFDDGRWGFQNSWSYFMGTEVMLPSGDFMTVYEHKTVRDEVARYLLARTQALQTHSEKHVMRDEFGRGIGDPFAMADGLEGARVTASQRYIEGEGADATNPEADRLTAEIAAAKVEVEKTNPEQLVAQYERLLGQFFATADPATRVMAILYISLNENDLDKAFLSSFSMEAVAWAVGFAAGLAVILWALSKLGPLGQLAAVAIRKGVEKFSKAADVGALITFGQWALNAGSTTSFGAAQRWAYIGAEVAPALSEMMRDFGAAKVRRGFGKFADWSFRAPADDPKALGNDVRNTFGDDPIGRQIASDIETRIREDLDKGGEGLLTKESVEFLKAADPDAYKRLQRDYPDHFKDALKPPPELKAGSAAAEMQTLVRANVAPEIAGRVRVVEIPGDAVRIKAKNGMLVVEVGKRAKTDAVGMSKLEGHVGAIRRLSRYAGPIGRIRLFLAKIGAAIGFLTVHTKGGEASEEVIKLKDIRDRLDGLRKTSEANLEGWAKRPDAVSDADIDAAVKDIETQLAKYESELGSTAVGKGFIAAEGKSNFSEIEAADVLNKPLDIPKLEALGYRVDKNNVIYRPKGAGETMEPLRVRGDKVEIADFESASEVQARVYAGLDATQQSKFDVMKASAPSGTKVRLVEGVHDTKATWQQILGGQENLELRKELRQTLQDEAGLSADEADRLILGLLTRTDTIKIVLGTDPVRSAHDYRVTAQSTGADIAHHFDPLYLGGGHKLLVNLPTGAHDSVHRFFDKLELPDVPGVSPRGAKLQPAALQAKVRATAKPAVVIVSPSGDVSYRLADEDWNL